VDLESLIPAADLRSLPVGQAPKLEAVESLLFDFGGTLDADGVAWKERFHALYQSEGLDMTAEDFAPAFFAADDALVGGLPPTAGLSETVHALAANLEAELTRRRVSPHPEPRCGASGVERWSRRRRRSPAPERPSRRVASGDAPQDEGGWELQADIQRGERVASRFLSEATAALARNRPVLEALSQRYRLGVVSNFYGNLEAVCESSGLAPLFLVMADSQRIGAEKPDPAIFRAALETLGGTPETSLFVGDSLRRDCEGARRAGIGFIWIAPEDVQAAEAQRAGSPRVLAALTKLPDLLAILK
jgi:HAD superfamily hydrolase (TIGR01509 family)